MEAMERDNWPRDNVNSNPPLTPGGPGGPAWLLTYLDQELSSAFS